MEHRSGGARTDGTARGKRREAGGSRSSGRPLHPLLRLLLLPAAFPAAVAAYAGGKLRSRRASQRLADQAAPLKLTAPAVAELRSAWQKLERAAAKAAAKAAAPAEGAGSGSAGGGRCPRWPLAGRMACPRPIPPGAPRRPPRRARRRRSPGRRATQRSCSASGRRRSG